MIIENDSNILHADWNPVRWLLASFKGSGPGTHGPEVARQSPLSPGKHATTFKQVSTGGEGQGEGELMKLSSFVQ